jgi:hypothetical protein
VRKPTVVRSFFVLAATLALLASSALPASAQDGTRRGDDPDGVVYVQSNEPSGNQVLVYARAENGSLTLHATHDTGGDGGRVEGAMADPLASQGSLLLDRSHGLLIGVNAGSDSVYAFEVNGRRLANRQVVASGGSFPVSLALHDDLLYVLNAKGQGSVQGFRIAGRKLHPIQNSTRSLALVPPVGPTAFVMTPGQVGFTPDGDQLIVTTKANGSNIDVFGVRPNGRLTETPVRNASTTPVPFAFTFDPRGRLVVGEAGTSNVSTYVVRRDGTTTPVGTQTDGQMALCWIVRVGGTYFVSNTGSGTESAFRIDAAGQPVLVGTTPVGSGPNSGPIDQAVSRDGAFLYLQLGNDHTVAILRIDADGSLTSVGSVPGTPSMEGIVAA